MTSNAISIVIPDASVGCPSGRTTVRTAPTMLVFEGTRVPSAAKGHVATVSTGGTFDGALVGFPAWSPPV